MLFYISIILSLILIISMSIKIAFLGSTLLKIKVEYVKYKHLRAYSSILYFILGLMFIIMAHIISSAINIPYEIVSSLFLWGGIVYIYSSLKMTTTMHVKERGIYHGVNIIKWKNIRECRFYSEYFAVEQKNGNILKFEIEQYKLADFKEILCKKVDCKHTF